MSQRRNRRSGVEDRWHKSSGERTARYGVGMRWRARYVDDQGREHAKAFARKVDAQAWLDGQTAAVLSGTHIAPRDANVTFSQWAKVWQAAYAVNRESSVENARTHIRVIETTFGEMALADIRPSTVKNVGGSHLGNLRAVVCACSLRTSVADSRRRRTRRAFAA
jgi:hypothetical protein